MRRPTMTHFGIAGYLPLIVGIILSSLMLLPIGTGVSTIPMPHFALMCVFYWSCSRPLLMPYGATAIMGFILDLWLEVPLGLNVLILVLARLFVMNQIKYFNGKSLLVYMGVFSVMCSGLFALMWVITSIIKGQFMPLEPMFYQLLLTLLLYPVVGFALGRVRRSFLSQ